MELRVQVRARSSKATPDEGEDSKVDCRVKGRYAAIKIESSASSQFNLSGYAIESEIVSDR